MGALAWARLSGIPQPLQKRLVDELAKKGIPLQFSRIYFDPFEGFVAHDAVLLKTGGSDQPLVSVNELGLKLNFQKLLQKQPALEELRIDGANLSVPLDLKNPEESKVTGEKVSATMRVIEGGLVSVDYLVGLFNGVHIELSGSVAFGAGAPIKMQSAGSRPNLFARIFKELSNVHFSEAPELSGQFRVDL